MRRLLIILLTLSACACNGQAIRFSSDGFIRFSEPMIDTTQLPDASSAILLHFENNLTDLGGATWVNPALYGWTGFSDTQPKFGIYSLKHDSTYSTDSNYWYSTTIPATFSIGTGDYTIEFWLGTDLKSSTDSSTDFILSFRVESAGSIISNYGLRMEVFNGNYRLKMYHSDSFSAAVDGYGDWMPEDLSWHHYAFVRNSGTLKGYIDGQEIISRSCTTNVGAISQFVVSAFNSITRQTEIQIDELHMCYGAKYTEEFTPPAKPFGAKKPMSIKF